MDATHFDRLSRTLSHAGARRGVLAFLSTLPFLGGLVSLFGEDDAEAKGRRKRRRKRHKHGQGRHKGKRKKPKKCKPKSRARTCAGKCGIVKNTCKKKIDCGSCACDPPCPVCQTCNDATGVCEPDPNQQGDACGEPGQVCQSDGNCACSPDPDTCPACTTCGGEGTCQGCSGCCDGDTCVAACGDCQVCDEEGQCAPCPDCCDGDGVCQPGVSNAACGSSGTCEACTGQEQCQNQSCVCVADCDGKICGPDGCGEQCGPGCPANATCSGNGTSCPCDFVTCDSTCCPQDESCCDTDCVDLQTDPNHCGTCGQVCGSEQRCWTGECVCGDVCPSGCQFTSVQAAIDGLAAGSTIRICPGTYGAITVNKSLTLIGAGQGTNAASNTILDAAGSGRVVSVDNGTTVSLRNLRITGGGSGVFFGGGIYNEGNLTLAACMVAQNTAQDSGGGIYNVSPGKLMLIDSTVSMNTANLSGGGINQNSSGAVTLDNTLVSLNSAGFVGGGITVTTSALNVTNGSTITENITPGGGGVTGNTASNGGGIFNDQGTVTLNGAPVTGNIPNNCAGSAVAGCSG